MAPHLLATGGIFSSLSPRSGLRVGPADSPQEGVGELDGDKLAPLLKLRYKNAIADALVDLGNAEQIRGLFIGFQRYLYEPSERLAAS
jgi:hypothetical protein